MILTKFAKNYIKQHFDDFDNDNVTEFFVRGSESLSREDFNQVVKFIRESELVDITTPLLVVIAESLVKNIELYLNQPKYIDPCCGWSRLQYQLFEIDTFDLKYQQIVNFLLKNKDEFGIQMNPLDAPYAYEGSDDYDLGWFKKDECDRLYSKEDWYN